MIVAFRSIHRKLTKQRAHSFNLRLADTFIKSRSLIASTLSQGSIREIRIIRSCVAVRILGMSRPMRVLAEIFVVAVRIYFGWETPFKDWAADARSRLTGKPTEVAPQEVVPTPAARTPTPRPRVVPGIQGLTTPTPHGSWMWDATHRGTLDRPTPSPTGQP